MRKVLLHEVVFGVEDEALGEGDLQAVWEKVPRFLREAFGGLEPVTLAWAGELRCGCGNRVVLVRVGYWVIESGDRDREER